MSEQIIVGGEATAARGTPAWARVGLRVEAHAIDPGIVRVEPTTDHRIQVYVGSPGRGACGHSRFVHSRGDICINPAGWTDTWEEYEATASLVMHMPDALLRRAAAEIGLDSERIGLEARHLFQDARIEHIAHALEAERRSAFPSGRIFSETLGLALAIHLLSHHKSIAMPTRGLSAAQLRRVTSYIDEHLAADLSLAQLSALTHMSASHFRMLFKRSTGLPVHEYVVRRRVHRAKGLLQSNLPVSQIALEVGFAHQSHMARAMRRVLGITPQAARAALRRS